MPATRKAVQVISDKRAAKLIVDPVNRQILRHLAEKELTQKMLADLLGLSDPSVYYHLKDLKAAGLVRIARSEAESHGIIQKFYEANAMYFIADYGRMPPELRSYFLAVNLERLRGILAILKATTGEGVPLSSGQMEEVADRVAYSLVEVARGYDPTGYSGRESLITDLYAEALHRLIEREPGGVAPLRDLLSVLGRLKR